jgi:hypothetical protein
MGEQVKELFAAIGEFAFKTGARNINELPGCWESDVGDKAWVSVNGHKESRTDTRGHELPPFHAFIEFNGWPAAFLGPSFGTVMGAAEDTLIDYFREAATALTKESE